MGRVLVVDRWSIWPAFFWMPARGEGKGRWVSGHVFPEHRPILQLTLDNAKADVPGASLEGAAESSSALGSALNTAKGAAKQFANDLLRRNEATKAEWMAGNGTAVFTDKATGKVLSPEEVKQRWEDEGKDMLPIEGADQQQGAQAVKDSPALGAAAQAAMILGSKGRSAARHPDDVVDSVGDLIKGRKGPDVDKRKGSDNPNTPKAPKMDQYEPPCFQPGADARKNYKGSDKDFEKEYHKQLKMQEEGINKMTVGEYLDNRRILQELTDQHGSEKAREILTEGGKAQAKERKDFREKVGKSIRESMKRKGIEAKEVKKLAEAQVKKQMEQLAALHNPDLIAGGKDEIGRMGNKGVNASIGAQWPQKERVTGMDDAANVALSQYGPDAKMNVKLERCR